MPVSFRFSDSWTAVFLLSRWFPVSLVAVLSVSSSYRLNFWYSPLFLLFSLLSMDPSSTLSVSEDTTIAIDPGKEFWMVVLGRLTINCFFSKNKVYWPVFIIATLAAIVASQATTSAPFSIIKQGLALGCLPRVKVVHTSKKFLCQIYIPDINWVLMVLCIAVKAGFDNQGQIGNAYYGFGFKTKPDDSLERLE